MSRDTKPATRDVELEQMSWTRLLFALLSQRFTGRVALHQSSVGTRSVVFHGGFPVLCDWVAPGTGLSEVLAGAGLLDTAAAQAVRDAAPEDGFDAHAHVIAQGLVDHETADMALRDQCERRVAAITALREGTLTLSDDTGIAEEVVATLSAARTLRVIGRAVQEWVGPQRAAEELALFGSGKVQITASFAKYRERFGFDSSDLASVATLTEYGAFTFEDLAHFSGLDPVRAMQILYTLWSCNMLVEAEVQQPVPAARGRSEISLIIELLDGKIRGGADPMDVLAVDADASLGKIEDAYQELGRRLSDGLEEDSAASMRQRVGELQASLQDVRAAAHARRRVTARSVANKALKENKFERALGALEDLARLEPQDAEVQLDLAWARWQVSERDERALRSVSSMVAEALDGQPDLAKGHLYRGRLLKHEGKEDAALRAFDRAASLDARLIDAQREARALRSGVHSVESLREPSRTTKPEFKPAGIDKGPRSKYWSGPWPLIWVVSGLLIGGLLAAQIVLRLDMDF